ncbi:hypothetical protein [Variovorax sp. PAMC26660]|uniref:hypothetical protein n=1 Tax=Variovorax sp. PAMC26660 TaxID=2762322 RepID=UPI00164D0DCF|nr:hypothetical protein [Variovorax sp. PAMC26660]QNK68679.1 hypothetical protein H7F35_02740 [Variovorax sp. PAMC26660]
MNPESQTLPGAPDVRMSRKTQALLGLALLLIGLVTMGVALVGAIGGALAGGCCGGHGGGSSGSSFWIGAGAVASGFGLALLLAAALKFRTMTVSIAYFGAVGLFMGIGAVSEWSRQRDMAHADAQEAAVFAPWKASFENHLADITKAIDADDPAALETAGKACVAFATTVPPDFRMRIDNDACGMGALDTSRLLDNAFTANAWRVLDRYLDLAQQEAQKSGTWRGVSIASAPGTCFADLAAREEYAPWLMKAEDRSTTIALRESGAIAKPQGPVPTDMLRVLANHRAQPLRAGEGALQRLFEYALSQRRMDIVQAVSRQVNGRFAWCSDGGAYAHNLVSAISPSSQGRVWQEGETALFQAIASWPQDPWREVANIYLGEFTRSSDTRPRSQTQASCKSAAARITALRPGADRASLIETCQAS